MKVVVASAHTFADQARLWFRFVARDLVPAMRAGGAQVEILLFRDAPPEGFEPRLFPGVTFLPRSFEALDVVEFHEKALQWPGDVLFLLDADVFVLDGPWVASLLGHFEDPTVAGVSLLRRGALPGVVALMARGSAFRSLAPPVLAPSYEGLDRPRPTRRHAGDRAALALRARGKKIIDVPAAEAAVRLADFKGASAIRTAHELCGAILGPRFETLIAADPEFTSGAYANLLLGSLFRAIFDAPYAAAPGPSAFASPGADAHLSGSATPDDLNAALAEIGGAAELARLEESFANLDRSLTRLADREGLTRGALRVPPIFTRSRSLARSWTALRDLFRKN